MLISDPVRYGMALARSHMRSALEALPPSPATDTARRILPSLIRDFDEKIGTDGPCGEGCRCGGDNDDSEMPYRSINVDPVAVHHRGEC